MSDRIELRLLGYPQILRDEQPVDDFISTKALLLFCYLVLEGGTQSREVLAALFWGDIPEKRAKSNLRQALHNIQKLFTDCFETTRQTVTLRDEALFVVDALDLQAVSQQDAATLDDLTRVSQCYRGDFMDGIHIAGSFRVDEWLRVQRERYHIAHMTVLESLARRYMIGGDWQQATVPLKQLIQVESWKESYHRDLMLCLAHQRDYSAAIKQYEQCQQMLMDEFGELPSYDTQQVYERILAARQRRYRQLAEHVAPLFGRQDEIAQIEGWLLRDDCHLITIVGQGGMGKTHLAQHVATRSHLHFLHGALFVSLAQIADEAGLVRALCEMLGVTQSASGDLFQPLLDYLQRVELLIVLDNYEHLSATMVERILSATSDITLLVTSRERLNLRQEYILELQGLAILDEQHVASSDAAQLFVQRAQQLQPEFQIDDEAAFIMLCRMVNGMPLALELAAGWVDTLSLAAINAEIQRNLDILSSPLQDLPERHRSIRKVFDPIWDSFSDPQQAQLLLLTVFIGDFSLEAAQAVARVSPFDLRVFVNRAWLHRTGEQRYGFHELIRQYLMSIPGDRGAIQAAHARYYANLLESLNGTRFDNPYVIGALDVLRLERDNLAAAWNWAVEQLDRDRLVQMIDSIAALYLQEARYGEVIALLEAIDDDTAQDTLAAKVSSHLGKAYYYAGQREASQAAFERSLTLAQHHEEQELIGLALHGVAACYMVTDWERCQALLEESITTLDACHDMVQAALTRNTLAAVYGFLGRRAEAIPLYQQAYDVLHALDDVRFATPLQALATVALEQGDIGRARTLLTMTYDIAEKTGNQSQITTTMLKFGDLELAQDNPDEARQYFEQALVASLHFGGSLMPVDGLGQVALRQGRYPQAIEQFSRAIRQSHNRDFQMIVLLHCAELLMAIGRKQPAAALVQIINEHPASASQTRSKVEKLALDESAALSDAIPELAETLHISPDFFHTVIEELPQ